MPSECCVEYSDRSISGFDHHRSFASTDPWHAERLRFSHRNRSVCSESPVMTHSPALTHSTPMVLANGLTTRWGSSFSSSHGSSGIVMIRLNQTAAPLPFKRMSVHPPGAQSTLRRCSWHGREDEEIFSAIRQIHEERGFWVTRRLTWTPPHPRYFSERPL